MAARNQTLRPERRLLRKFALQKLPVRHLRLRIPGKRILANLRQQSLQHLQHTQLPGDLCHFSITELKPQIPPHAPNDAVISETTAVKEGIAATLSAHPLILLHILQSTL
jgi:hypothetical protein